VRGYSLRGRPPLFFVVGPAGVFVTVEEVFVTGSGRVFVTVSCPRLNARSTAAATSAADNFFLRGGLTRPLARRSAIAGAVAGCS